MGDMAKKWIIKDKYNGEWADKFPEINSVVLQLLFNRGLDTQDKIDQFLGPDYLRDQGEPFLFREMKVAVERIFQALDKQEKIVIYEIGRASCRERVSLNV